MKGEMKVAVMEGIGKMGFTERPIPTPKDDEVLVKLEYVGICGSDLHYYEHGRIGDYIVEPPFVLGHEPGGTVVEVGKNVKHLKAGDRVALEPGKTCGHCEFCKTGRYNLCPDVIFFATPPVDGVFQEYVAHEAGLCFKLPDNVDTMEGALIEPLAVGFHAAKQGGAAMGQTAVVTGSGCIGLVTMMALKALGVDQVYVVDIMQKRLDKAMELGATGVEVEDHVSLTEEEMKVMYVDLLPDDIAPDDGKAKISCYFDENENLEHITMQIQAMLERLRGFMDIGAGTISFDKTKEEDWVNNWKKFFKPIRLDEQIVIKPTWETLEDQTEDTIVVEIDPGTAFGTGSHETTKLCIEGMKPYIKEDTKILDVGCGSGILSIIGLKLGAGHAVLTDIDPHAISASEENFEVNHISKDQFEVYQGNVLDDKEFAESLGSKCYPVVVANILADVISPLIEIVDQFLAEDGVFVISGIIDTKEKEIADKLNAYGFDVIETRRMKDWVSMTAKMR